MALEDRLLGNFQRLRPEQRQLIVEFSEFLLKQAASQQDLPASQEQELSENERKRRLAIVDEMTALANHEAGNSVIPGSHKGDPSSGFGLWKDRDDVSLRSLRDRAWKRL